MPRKGVDFTKAGIYDDDAKLRTLTKQKLTKQTAMLRTLSNPRPTPTAAERSFRQLIRTFGLVERVMQPYFARFGISGAQWGVLRNLHRAEQEGHPGLRLTDLSRRMLIRPPSVTGIADRLEKVGLIVRRASETDGRSKHVALTEKGRHLVEQVLTVHATQLGRVMGGLSADEQEQLDGLLVRLAEHIAVLADGTGD
jgi:DNA-binding MarR family transcriptional regulator